MKAKLVSLIVTAAAISASQATVVLNFNNAFAGGVSAGFADKVGTVSNGLTWGVVVDTGANGFLSSYDPAGLTPGSVSSLFAMGGAGSDDVLALSTDLTQNTSAFSEGDFVTPGADGGITAVSNLALSGGIATGNPFAVVWFDSDGINAGLLTHPSFVIPADGSASDFDQPFVGVDPARPADDIQFGVIPEPSVAILGALGVLGLVRRRR